MKIETLGGLDKYETTWPETTAPLQTCFYVGNFYFNHVKLARKREKQPKTFTDYLNQDLSKFPYFYQDLHPGEIYRISETMTPKEYHHEN